MHSLPTTAVEPVIRRHVPRSRYRLGASCARATLLLALVGTTGLAGVGVLAVLNDGGYSKADIGRLTVKKYAYEAFPAFRYVNPGRACPANLAELNAWMDTDGTRDPWGNDYVMHCAADGIVVRSSGEDAIWGTADDVWSDR